MSKLLPIPEKQTDNLKDVAFCATNPLYFMKYHYHTSDPNDRNNPIKLFPMDWLYLQDLVCTWYDLYMNPSIEILGAVEHKTRQLLVSTGGMGFIMWVWLYAISPVSIKVITETSDKCYNGTKNSLMGKIKFAWERLEPHLKQSVEFKSHPIIFENPNNGAVIVGSTTTDSAGRGDTFDIVWVDEMAYLGNQMQDLYTSMVPLTNMLLMCSTPNGNNFWKWIVESTRAGKLPYVYKELPCTVHPHRDAKYFEVKRKQLPKAQYAKEYGLSFEMTQEGVCFDIDMATFIVNAVFKPGFWKRKGWKLVYGMDFGMADDTSIVFGLINQARKRLTLIGSYTANDMIPETFLVNTVNYCSKSLNMGDEAGRILSEAVGYCDPAGNQRNLNNGRTVHETYVSIGLKHLYLGDRMENKHALIEMARWISGGLKTALSASEVANNLQGCHYPMDKHGRITDFDTYAHEGQGVCNFNSHVVSAIKYLLSNVSRQIEGAQADVMVQHVYQEVRGAGRRKR